MINVSQRTIVQEESCRHPTQTELPEQRATVSLPRQEKHSAAVIGPRTPGGALIGCKAKSYCQQPASGEVG
jgi:hypothetical protein